MLFCALRRLASARFDLDFAAVGFFDIAAVPVMVVVPYARLRGSDRDRRASDRQSFRDHSAPRRLRILPIIADDNGIGT